MTPTAPYLPLHWHPICNGYQNIFAHGLPYEYVNVHMQEFRLLYYPAIMAVLACMIFCGILAHILPCEHEIVLLLISVQSNCLTYDGVYIWKYKVVQIHTLICNALQQG